MFLTPHHVLSATIFFSAFMLTLLVCMIFALLHKNKRDKTQHRWLSKTNVLITKAIFFDDEENSEFKIPINRRVTELLKNPLFRQTLINELVISSKSISGTSAENLSLLYKQLDLNKDSLTNLQKNSWHKKAKAIQELAIMYQTEFSPQLYQLTNDKNEFIRMEAQISIVKFHGFDGLKFLSEITYPISEWHQINLLKELSAVSAADFKGIDTWLKSANHSVIVFALKLCASYYQFDQYSNIVGCLIHSNPKIRLQAINCLKEIYDDHTSLELIRIYQVQPTSLKLAILKALQKIGSEESISFLQGQLDSGNNQIKIATARALFHCGEEGAVLLDSHQSSHLYPLVDIIRQIKMEK